MDESEQLWIIYCGGDGYRAIPFLRGELSEIIREQGLRHRTPVKSVAELGNSIDPADWGQKYLILRGPPLVPIAHQTVTEWVIEGEGEGEGDDDE